MSTLDRLLRTASEHITREDNSEDTIAPKTEAWIIAIEKVEYLKDYVLQLQFSDGKTKKVDFGPFLHQSRNPLIRHYLDIDTFKQFTHEHGDLHWNDYDLCFPIADLYEGKV